MHLSNLLQPWVSLRLLAGFVALVLFARAAQTSWRVLRVFDAARATERQLALERRCELAWTYLRIATVVQVSTLVLAMLAGDRLSDSIRGAMCGYGVFSASSWGFPSLAATAATSLAAGTLWQIQALDARVRTFDLVRAQALATLLIAPLAAIDFALALGFALDLDLTVVASCCSVQLDSIASGAAIPHEGGMSSLRLIAAGGAVCTIIASIATAYWGSLHPRKRNVLLAAALASITLPFALAAIVLFVAPHAFELPQHVCPFCLFRTNVLGIGYPLFGAILLAMVSAFGAGVGTLISRTEASQSQLAGFVKVRLRREAFAWALVIVVGALPVVRYAIVSGGAPLFP